MPLVTRHVHALTKKLHKAQQPHTGDSTRARGKLLQPHAVDGPTLRHRVAGNKAGNQAAKWQDLLLSRMRHHEFSSLLVMPHGDKVEVPQPHSGNGATRLPAAVDGKPAQPHGEILRPAQTVTKPHNFFARLLPRPVCADALWPCEVGAEMPRPGAFGRRVLRRGPIGHDDRGLAWVATRTMTGTHDILSGHTTTRRDTKQEV